MSDIEAGTYRISKSSGNQNLVPEDGMENSYIIVAPVDHGNEDISKWKFEKCSDDNYYIRNEAFDGKFYLAPNDVEFGGHIVSKSHPFEWRIQPTSEKDFYHIVVPGGPIDGKELAVDYAPERIFPPRTALAYLRLEDVGQAWLVKKL